MYLLLLLGNDGTITRYSGHDSLHLDGIGFHATHRYDKAHTAYRVIRLDYHKRWDWDRQIADVCSALHA